MRSNRVQNKGDVVQGKQHDLKGKTMARNRRKQSHSSKETQTMTSTQAVTPGDASNVRKIKLNQITYTLGIGLVQDPERQAQYREALERGERIPPVMVTEMAVEDCPIFIPENGPAVRLQTYWLRGGQDSFGAAFHARMDKVDAIVCPSAPGRPSDRRAPAELN